MRKIDPAWPRAPWWLVLLLFVATALALAVQAGAQPTSTVIGPTTVATLPTAVGRAGRVAAVTDASSSTSCASGGGSNKLICQSDGTNWIAIASGGISFPYDALNGDVTFNNVEDFNINFESSPGSMLLSDATTTGGHSHLVFKRNAKTRGYFGTIGDSTHTAGWTLYNNDEEYTADFTSADDFTILWLGRPDGTANDGLKCLSGLSPKIDTCLATTGFDIYSDDTGYMNVANDYGYSDGVGGAVRGIWEAYNDGDILFSAEGGGDVLIYKGNLGFEGATIDTIQTRVVIADPTGSDKSIYVPNADSGTAKSLTCGSTDKFSAFDAATNTFTCTADAGGGGGDSIRVEDGNNAGTFTAMSDADFDDSGDINFARAAGPPDVLTATVRADSVALTTDTTGNYAAGDAEAGAALTGDSATAFFSSGTIEDARIDGSAEADEVNPTLGSQTQGNYVSSATSGGGLTLTGTEGGSLGIRTDCGTNQAPTWDGDSWECGGGTLKSDTATVGNVGSGEDDLITYSLPGGTLGTNGDAIYVEAFGVTSTANESKQVRCYFGATKIADSSAWSSAVAADWNLRATIVRTGAATQRVAAYLSRATGSDGQVGIHVDDYTTPAETLSGAVTIKCTGAATTTDAVQQTGLIVSRYGGIGAGSGGGGGTITLDIGDDGGNDSTGLTEISDNGRKGEFSEPSADKLKVDWTAVGGFGQYDPDRVPPTGLATAWSDEYNNGCALTYATINSGPTSSTCAHDTYELSQNAESRNIRGQHISGSSGISSDFSMYAKVVGGELSANTETYGLIALDTGSWASPTKILMCQAQYNTATNGANIGMYSRTSYSGAQSVAGAGAYWGLLQVYAGQPYYLWWQYTASTKVLNCYFSSSGMPKSWNLGGTATLTNHPDLGIFVDAQTGAGVVQGTFYFVRTFISGTNSATSAQYANGEMGY